MRPLLISITVFCHLAFMVAPQLIDGWYQLYNSNTQHRFSVLLLSVFFPQNFHLEGQEKNESYLLLQSYKQCYIKSLTDH